MDKMSSMAKSLLPQPIFKMLQEIEDLKTAETLARTEAAVPTNLTEESLAQLDRPSKKKVVGQMWTDRYRPTKYVDLLGDDVSLPSCRRWPSLNESKARQSSCHVLAQGMGRLRLQDGCCAEREEEGPG
jgi:hypothetical protein